MELISDVIRNITVATKTACSICGREYKQITVGKEPFLITCYEAQCDCEKKAAMQADKQREEREQREAAAQLLLKRFDNSMMSKRLKRMEFENLTPSENTKELEFCKNYVMNFDTEKSKGIQLLGNTGAGKSSLMACVCNSLIKRGYNCLFTTLSALLSDFVQYSGEHFGSISAKLNWLLKYDFIVLDDIGRESITDKRKEILFQIVDSLYNEEKIIAFTANPEMLDKLKKDKELTAILDRIKSLCPHVLQFRGMSLR